MERLEAQSASAQKAQVKAMSEYRRGATALQAAPYIWHGQRGCGHKKAQSRESDCPKTGAGPWDGGSGLQGLLGRRVRKSSVVVAQGL